MSTYLYLKNAISKIEQTWGNLSKLFTTGCGMDISVRPKYHPELDNKRLLDDNNIQLYQIYIEIIRWEIELGRVDLYMASGVMAGFSAFPRESHIVAVLKILAYFKNHIQSKLVFDSEKRDTSEIK